MTLPVCARPQHINKCDYPSVCAGGLVHFNCHNQELTPFRPAGIALVIEKLLVGCDTTEDALAAAFCLLRCA